jgi:hypothetical protein
MEHARRAMKWNQQQKAGGNPQRHASRRLGDDEAYDLLGQAVIWLNRLSWCRWSAAQSVERCSYRKKYKSVVPDHAANPLTGVGPDGNRQHE